MGMSRTTKGAITTITMALGVRTIPAEVASYWSSDCNSSGISIVDDYRISVTELPHHRNGERKYADYGEKW